MNISSFRVSASHWRTRLAVAAITGAVFFSLTLLWLSTGDPRREAGDFTYAWLAARALLQGREPYATVLAESPFRTPFFYPLPAALVALPVATLPARFAGAVFVGTGVAWLAFRLSESGWWRLLVLTAAPALFVVLAVQWSPLLTAAALTGPALGLAIVKPTIGLALAAMALPVAGRPRRLLGQTTAVALALVALTLVIRPDWPGHWISAVTSGRQTGQFRAPILTVYGFPTVLALLRWRRPEGRLLVALACVRQNGFLYDQLPLLLIPASAMQAIVLSVTSHVSHIVALWQPPANGSITALSDQQFPFTVVAMYLPCLVMVLLRPNEGSTPAWLERATARWPTWLRGSAPVTPTSILWPAKRQGPSVTVTAGGGTSLGRIARDEDSI